MKQAKSQLLRSLLKRYRQASFLNKHPHIDTESFVHLERTDPYTRRKFLGDSIKTIALLGLTSTVPFISCRTSTDNNKKTSEVKEDKRQPVIAIVGGGLAGLNCAYQLKKQHIIAKVYEADKRTGGRILSKKDALAPGLTTEFGGEFIDTNNQDMLDLVKEFGLEMYDTHKDIADNKLNKDVYYFGGRKRTDKEVINQFRKVAMKMEDDRIKCGDNFDTPIARQLDNTSIEQYVNSLKCEQWFKDLLNYAYTAEFGLDAGEQSSLNLIDFISTETENGFAIFGDSDERFKVIGGNAKVPEAVYQQVKEQVVSEMKLTAIRNEGNAYSLSFEGGKEVKADFVVLAIPFTMLRNVDIKLNGIKPEKLQCIKELGYGQNNKLILATKNRVWRESRERNCGYLFHPDVQNGWDSSQMQTSNKGAGSYTVFLGGTTSLKMAKAAAAQNLKDTVPDLYPKKYLPKLEKVFPGMQKAYSGTHKAALWSNNPFINASYATYKTGQWTSISGFEQESVGNVFFAGEHCSIDFQGYMNGAAETGRVAAEGIMAKMNVLVK